MAPTVDEIAEILNTMRVENEHNVDNFEKVLKGINSKLELMADDNESTDLIKLYLSELKKIVEDKHSSATSKFSNLENSINSILSSNEQLAKTSELRELFQLFSANFDTFSNEFSNQKKVLDNFNTDLEGLSEKTFNKDEFTSLLSGFLSDLSEMNISVNKSFKNIEDSMANAIEQISSIDVSEQVNSLNSKISSLKDDVNSIPSKISLTTIEEKISYFQTVLDSLKNIISDIPDDDKQKLEILQNLVDDIKNVESLLTSNNEIFQDTIRENIISIKDYINELGDTISNSQTEAGNKLGTKLEVLEGLNNSFESSLVLVNSQIKNVLEAVTALDYTEQNNYVKEEIRRVVSSCESLMDVINNINRRNDELSEILSYLTGIVLKKEDISDFSYKLDEYSEILTSLKELVSASVDTNAIDFQNLFDKVENSFENIISKEDFWEFKTELSDLFHKITDNSNTLNAVSSFNRDKILEITDKISRIEPVDYSYDLEQISTQIEDLSVLFENSSNNNYDNITQKLDEIKIQISDIENDEKLINKLNEFSEIIQALKDIVTSSSDISIFREQIAKIENLFSHIVTDEDFMSFKIGLNDLLQKILDNSGVLNLNTEENKEKIGKIGKIVEQLEVLNYSENFENIDGRLSEIKEVFENNSKMNYDNIINEIQNLKARLDFNHDDTSSSGKENFERLSFSLSELSGNVTSFREHVDETVESLKDYINELNAASKSLNGNQFSEKLLDLESAFVNFSEDYEAKMQIFQNKLTEFIQVVETASSGTDAKISSSIEEINSISQELSSVNKNLNTLKQSSDEKSLQIISVLNDGIAEISDSVSELNNIALKNINSEISTHIALIEDKFTLLSDTIESLKKTENTELFNGLDDKIFSLKQEISLINIDITDALQSKTEEIMRAFEPLKIGVEGFTGYDFDKLLNDLKSQMESSFMNFSVDVNGEIAANAESFLKLEQAYKETYNKISDIEECVSEKIQNSIEMLNITVETNAMNLKCGFEQKLDEYINDLKDELSGKLDIVAGEENSLLAKTQSISGEITNLGSDLKRYIKSVHDNTLDKYKPSEYKESMNTLHQKVDLLVTSPDNDEILSSLTELEIKADEIGIDLAEKISALHDKFNEFPVTDDKVAEMISVLHEKVDILAMDDSDFNIEDEIDDIKGLIFEQRKYFEAASDEKAAAIDKYLRDVLLKLENVDFEKNSEDIKESIMNALLSLTDQISFVEETEEIKDFVEEKTEAINQNIIEVKNQLKQIASSNEGFDYSYTLQDVESDIAKLRLAISTMSENGFGSFSDDIKKIVSSVEELESSLTQDQMTDLKTDIEKLNEDILSISSRTNKLLLTSDESYKAVNDGLNNFSSLIYKLEDRINNINNSATGERLERKIDNIHSMSVASVNADRVFHQVMMYLGEWIDSTTENISSIAEKTSEISKIKKNLQELKEAIPEKSEILNGLENKFEQQELRIDRLEMKLEKILSILEEKDNKVLNRKVDKVEKMISGLTANIEKLASYVDEE